MLGDHRLIAVCTMACVGSGRLCARGVEKLCQLGQKTQVRRKPSAAFVRIKEIGIQPLTRTLAQNCQVHVGNTGCTDVQSPQRRHYSYVSTQHPGPGSLPDYQTHIDPYRLLEDDLKDVYRDIRQELRWNTNQEELQTIATYYFDGEGKALRPMVTVLMARAINYHMNLSGLLPTQRQVALIAEMIHSASLIHDDVIDQSDFRRGKPSVNALWNHKKVAMAGDFILAVTSIMIARLRNNAVTISLSQIVADLVQGEFMQLGSKETENERFAHYLTKTYRKTASLIANSLKSVAILAGADEQLSDIAFQYGRNIGLAFQLVDDLLDFVSSSDTMGKPTAADLKLGLATAPVLFACEKYPELNPMIMRRFQEPGDVEKAFELVHKSQGLEQTRFLARKHCIEAARLAGTIAESPYQKALTIVTDLVAMAGDFILAVTSIMIARLRNNAVTISLSQIVADLVQGEFMQLGSKETENERFAHYLTKTYRKTASLIANSLKSVAILAGADEQLSDIAFQYGRNIGLAFQLVDDLLDFVSSSDTMGKPTAADLKLGLATAPVLFACEKYPELNPMIMRRFQEPGDVEKAFELVHKSQGLEQTRFLARKHCIEAARLAGTIAESPYQKALTIVTDLVINRMK